ncbi:MAG: protoheme IX farnesyltransferase [Anaerolineales bacterium]
MSQNLFLKVYSIVLKKNTAQNVVIGGGTGAISPLVGWEAVTGELTLPAIMLFMIVFLWTPPHFWALALVRVRDYRAGGVPMLPVVRGEVETCRQIFIYTLELAAITLLVPLTGIGGGLYIFSAMVLGIALIYMAWKLWRKYAPKLAWKMYRYSSIYLIFLFLAMMVDAVI